MSKYINPAFAEKTIAADMIKMWFGIYDQTLVVLVNARGIAKDGLR